MSKQFFELDIKPKPPEEIPVKSAKEKAKEVRLKPVEQSGKKESIGLKLGNWLRIAKNAALGQAQRLLKGESLGFGIKKNTILFGAIALGIFLILKLLKVL